MPSFIIRRTLHSLFVIWGAVTIIFLVVRVVSGDPARLILGTSATDAQVADLRHSLGLDQTIFAQYIQYIFDIIRLDFGESYRLGGSAIGVVIERLPYTFSLAIGALIFSIIISFPLGIMAAKKPNGIRDKLISLLSLLGQSLPTFWVGIMLLLIFARNLNILPSAGASTLAHYILPSIVLALPFLGMLVRLIRSGFLEQLNEGYVQTARSKGLNDRIIYYVHVLRNVLVPVVTMLGLLMGLFIGSAVIIEVVFSWPGIGQLLVQSILSRDYPVVQATVAIIASFYVFINLTVDILYAYIDPRIRMEV